MNTDREAADTWGLVDTLLDAWEHRILDVARTQERLERERQRGWQAGYMHEYVPPCGTKPVTVVVWGPA